MARVRTTSAQGLAFSAAAALLKYLRSDAGQEQLRKAPQLMRWARQHVASSRPKFPGRDVIDSTASDRHAAGELGGGLTARPRRTQLVDRFGHRGLSHRLDGVRRGVVAAYGDDGAARAEVDAGLAEIERALAVGSNLPASKRIRLYRQVDRQLDSFEDALVDAALGTVNPSNRRSPSHP